MLFKTWFVTFCLIFNVFFIFRYEERLAVSVTNLAKTSLEADKLQKVKKSREFELISIYIKLYKLQNVRLQKNWIDQYIKLKSSEMQHWRLPDEKKTWSAEITWFAKGEGRSAGMRRAKILIIIIEIIIITINNHIIKNLSPPDREWGGPSVREAKRGERFSRTAAERCAVYSHRVREQVILHWSDLLKLLKHYICLDSMITLSK